MMDPAERELFAKGIQHAMATASVGELDAALDALGWQDALALDPATTVATLFEHQGAAGASSSALDVVMATALRVDLDGPTGVVLPALGSVAVPGRVAQSALVVHGLATSGIATRARAVVVADDGAHLVDTATLALIPVAGLDPRLGLFRVGAERLPTEPATPSTDWPAAVAAGQRALAHELVGGARTMLRLARDHAVDRIQFDRPIAQFQAVRHRLAESLVAIEAAAAAADAAWDEPTPLTAALAKAIAGRSARVVARHCQQVLAGIGFTTEHPLHHHVRRALVLDHLLGDARSLTAALGDELLAARRLPSLLPL
jgi:hypothetical protein